MTFNRRRLIKMLVGLPVVGGLITIFSPLFRYLKPDHKPWQIFTLAPDQPKGGAQVVGRTSALKQPWDVFYFTYVQKYVQYDPTGYKASNVPGVAVHLPKDVKFVNAQGFVGFDGATDIALFQRICPHLGAFLISSPTGTR